MKVKFLRDVFNAGTKLFEAGREYSGDLARYVRRGDAEEVKAGTAAPAAEKPKSRRKGK